MVQSLSIKFREWKVLFAQLQELWLALRLGELARNHMTAIAPYHKGVFSIKRGTQKHTRTDALRREEADIWPITVRGQTLV